jgi:hypothetical protein
LANNPKKNRSYITIGYFTSELKYRNKRKIMKYLFNMDIKVACFKRQIICLSEERRGLKQGICFWRVLEDRVAGQGLAD